MKSLFPFCLFALLAGCNAVEIPNKAAEMRAEQAQRAMQVAEGRVECAHSDDTVFAADCTIDRTQTQDGLYLTLRHADGGFRRLLVTRDGRGVVAADGAEPAHVTPIAANRIEVALGDMRYRLPATVRGAKAR